MKTLWIFLGVITKLGLFEGHFYAFRVFFKVKVQNWDIFGLLEIPDIFGG